MAPFSRRACTAVAALLLSVAVILLHGHPAAAQQSTPPPALAAPELTAQAADGTIELTWTEVPGAAHYELWSWTTDVGWLQLGGDDLTATTFSHPGLAPGAAYYYQIRAVSAADEVGVWSQQVSVSLPSHLPAPALTARASAAVIDLSWDAVDGAARYELWIWWGEDTGWQQFGGDNLTATSYTHTKITPDVTYYYQMRAVDAAGVASPWSQQVSAVVTQEQPPDATLTPTASPPSVPSATPTPIASPTSTTVPVPAATPTATPPVPLLTHSLLVTGDAPPVLVARAIDGAVELTWDPVTGAAYYDLRSWTEAGGWQHLGEHLTGAIFHHTGLTAYTIYYYWIRTVDELGGTGPWSERVSATLTTTQASASAPTPTPLASLTPTTTPSPTPTTSTTGENSGAHTATPTPTQTATPTPTPTQLAASSEFTPPVLTASASVGAVELRWGPVAGAVRYILQSWTSPDGWKQLGGDNLTSTTFNHTGLTIGADYYYWVRAVNASGDMTDWSARADVTIPSARPPASTPTPTPTATANETLNESPTPTPTPSPTATNTATATITPTASPTPPSGPAYGFVRSSNITIIRDFPNLTLIWTPAPGAVHYNIYYCLSLSGGSSICREDLYFRSVYELIGHELTVTTFLHENLSPSPPGQRYSHFYVIQACFRTECPILTQQQPTATPSPISTATPTETSTATPTPTASSAATGFSAPVLTAVATESAVELNWNAVPTAVRYELWYWTDATGWLRLDNGDLTANSFTHNNLSAGTTYYYGVRSVNAAGDFSPWSEYVPATPTSGLTPTSTPSLTPTPTSTPAASAGVSAPPSSLNVHSYYRKYLDVGGIPILSSNEVTDEELYQARDTILAMLSDRPDILATMAEFRFRVLIYPDRFEKGGLLTHLPEFRGLDLSSRVLGAAGRTPYGWVSGSPEVARHCNHTLIHEFAHQIEDALRLQPGSSDFLAKLNSAFQAAMLRGLWQDRYASTNALEYWAEIVRAWLTPSQFAGWLGPGYQKLEDYDPVGAALVAEVLGNPTPLTFCEIRRFDLRGTVNLPGNQSSHPYTYVIQLSMRSPAGAKRLLGTSAAVSRSDGAFAFERLIVENVFLNAPGDKPHIVIGIYRYDNAGNAACPVAAFLSNDGTFTRSTDPTQWRKFEVTGNDISGLSLTIPPVFDWNPVHKCI